MSAESTTSSEAPPSARGGLFWITGAKLYFVVIGYAVQLVLPRLLGSEAAFGRYSSAMNILSIVNNVLIATTLQTTSKLVSENEANTPAVHRRALRFQVGVGLALATALFLAAEPLARYGFRNPALAPLWRVGSVVFFAYALYATCVGVLNGRRRFARQAQLDVTFSTLRTTGILLGPLLGFGALGAIAGFSSAAVAILLIALVVVGLGGLNNRKTGAPLDAPTVQQFATLMLPLALYQGALNVVLQFDLSILGATAASIAANAGAPDLNAAKTAERLTGLYRAAQTFAFVPYQLMLSATFIVFPLVSRATATGSREEARALIAKAMRLSLLVLIAIAAPIAGASAGVLRIAYKPEYLVAADALRVLTLAMIPFTLFVIAATALSGSGSPFVSAKIGWTGAVILGFATWACVRHAGTTDRALVWTAFGTLTGTVSLFTMAAFALRSRFGSFLSGASTLRVLIAGAVGFAVAAFVPSHSRVLALIALTAGGLAYVATLFVTRELSVNEVRDLLTRRKPGAIGSA